jgi:23S rRNA pseudouridine1911/1915/1917 synthase
VAAAGGLIDRPIGRDPRDRKRMSVRVAGGRAAVTRWEVAERLAGATVLRLFPKTGRTHQLRVHLAALGHPIVGDAVYGGRQQRARGVSDAVAAALAACPRQALHARRLRFRHPRHGRDVEISSTLPDDLRRVIDAVRAADATPKKLA